ncbi:GntR family transcriptional regulator [Actinokineospora bangkokensis]|uniref:GntR family transcriptional regulator n=1 Tax=Actinokineospora bangkokensis TaxID=1193682 RepID=A0A1Q9LEJ3_9PSEU|nr:GntR family transcriptional regulator [Actinokineospora bangkokensis]OLR90434.1 GntR family transcriptional regulator [Actinokineospora bangkokensis]
MIPLDPTAATPPYEQVRAGLAARITSGELAVGTKLPTVRALAADLGLATNTVARAYRELESAGLLETRGRAGTYVSADGDDVLTKAREAADRYATEVRALGLSPTLALDIAKAALDH